ncbi:DUF5343 domain-containing protein [Paenibacillus sp. tmac-D7]|uniref:DUF5343 domain-containing protein n=1 Tax=Paenibacillus sp. tmac-D7 TaxID=2591462 RepID=UPI00114125BB|nr:DUF5343 domain-containing protein [Paenibacillus sp. tmac-D7]
MGLSHSYLITTKNLNAFINAIISAKAPERFTTKFLHQLEFTSSNDRLYIGVLKSLGLIDESGVPTQRYYNFLDQTQSGAVLAEAIREAYSDLFAINTKAQELSVEEVKNKLRTLTQGQKSNDVIQFMANTFKALCEYADWKAPSNTIETSVSSTPPHQDKPQEPITLPIKPNSKEIEAPQLHYNIQIILPETRDPLVYDAIFRSLKEHLY